MVQKPHGGGDRKWRVQTNEEAQENDHDLDLFVTVQLLDEMTAVLSVGKLAQNTDIHMSGLTVKNHI